MRIAVSGASGFIGRHVVADLESRRVPLTLVYRPGSAPPQPRGPDRIVEIDIADPPSTAFEQLGRPDVLIHLAWGGLPNYSSPSHVEHELPAQKAFLTRLLADGLQSLTVAGTCLEYGLLSGELREDMPTSPITMYGRAKDSLRAELERIHAARPFMLTWARLFYLYGDGQAAGSLLPQLERAIARGDATFDMSGGAQLRDYLPVTTAAQYLVRLALSGRDNGVVNVCSGEPISVLDLVRSVVAQHDSHIELNLGRVPYPEYEPMAFWGDRGKLTRILGDC